MSEAVLAGQVYAEKVADRLTTEIGTESRERKAAVENADRVSGLRAEHLQEQADELAEGYIQEVLARREETQILREQIQVEQSARVEADEKLADELHESISSTREALRATGEHLQEQADDNAEALIQEVLARQELDKALQTGLAASAHHVDVRDEHLQEQLDELSSNALDVRMSLQHEINERAKAEKHIQEQIDDNIETEIRTLSALNTESRQRRESVSRLGKKVTGIQEYLDEAVADLSESVMTNAVALANTSKEQKADIESLKSSTEGLARVNQIYDEGLQEQIDQLAELRLAQILKDYQDSKDRKAQAERERLRQQEEADHLQAQADEVSEAVIQAMLHDTRERERLGSRITLIEEALAENEILIPASASLMTNTEVNNMIDNVLNGSDSTSPEPRDEDDADVYNMIDDVFNGNDTDTYEDEVTDDIDNIFNP